MNFDNILFVVIVVAWLALRVGTRVWLRRKLASGAISADGALFVHAATFAVIPLLALPWRHSPSEIALLVAMSAMLFLGQLTFARLMLRYLQGR